MKLIYWIEVEVIRIQDCLFLLKTKYLTIFRRIGQGKSELHFFFILQKVAKYEEKCKETRQSRLVTGQLQMMTESCGEMQYVESMSQPFIQYAKLLTASFWYVGRSSLSLFSLFSVKSNETGKIGRITRFLVADDSGICSSV